VGDSQIKCKFVIIEVRESYPLTLSLDNRDPGVHNEPARVLAEEFGAVLQVRGIQRDELAGAGGGDILRQAAVYPS
jgi:hypothetical protein